MKTKRQGNYRGSVSEKPILEIVCVTCGKTVSTRRETTKYCSRKCVQRKPLDQTTKDKISNSCKGKTGGYRTKSGLSKKFGGLYKDVWLDSSWEISFALRMDEIGVKWERPRSSQIFYTTQRGTQARYYPDFYLPDFDKFVEIKGYYTNEVRHKLSEVSKTIPLIIIDKLSDILNAEVAHLVEHRPSH